MAFEQLWWPLEFSKPNEINFDSLICFRHFQIHKQVTSFIYHFYHEDSSALIACGHFRLQAQSLLLQLTKAYSRCLRLVSVCFSKTSASPWCHLLHSWLIKMIQLELSDQRVKAERSTPIENNSICLKNKRLHSRINSLWRSAMRTPIWPED